MNERPIEVSPENKSLSVSELFEEDEKKRKKVYSMIPSYPDFISMEDLLNKALKDNNISKEEIIRSTNYLLYCNRINLFTSLNLLEKECIYGRKDGFPYYQRCK